MNIIKSLINEFKSFDIKIKNILSKGVLFSFILSIISIIFLITYEFSYKIPDLFYIGLSLFRSSLMFACSFVICAIGFNTIKKEII
ncbi:MAG: hypothetical protein GX682_04565 [Clostridiaceae bacterium]|nr:hypothetical protein [Clostridiaceae bacterium]